MSGPLYYDRVKETSTTTGSGDFILAGAVNGYVSFNSVLNSGDTCYYCIEDFTNNQWEIGLGTKKGTTTLGRTTVKTSTNSNSLVTFSAGTHNVMMVVPAAGLSQFAAKAWCNITCGSSFTVNSSYNVASVLRNSAGDYTFNLATAFGNSQFVVLATAGFGLAINGDRAIQEVTASRTSSAVRLTLFNFAGTVQDDAQINVAMFGA